MAMADIPGGMLLGYPADFATNTAGGFQSMLLDAAGESAAMVVQAPKTGNIRKVHFRTGTVTTGATVDVRLETVSTTNGDPTGTLFGTNTNASHAIADSDDNAWLTTGNLTADAAVTIGDTLAIVIVAPSGFNGNIASHNIIVPRFPYTDHFASGAWTKSVNIGIGALEYDDGSIVPVPGLMPWSAFTLTTFNSGSSPDERGIIFQVPFRCRCVGWWMHLASTEDHTVKLYDSDGTTVLASKVKDKDITFDTNTRGQYGYFAATATLKENTNYRLTLLPSSTTNLTLAEFSTASVALMGAMLMGTSWHLTTRADAGSWTETTTQRALLGPIIDGVESGIGVLVGGGGMVR